MSADAFSATDPAAHAAAVVARSGTSFALGMRILPRPRREAMYAIYAFCREVDDAADEPNPDAVKLALLANWRHEVEAVYAGRPQHPVGRALAPAVARYDLPKAELLAVIDGMEMDVRDGILAPDLPTLQLYCRRVAGAVGILSLNAFGAAGEPARRFAVALGEALQLTNILRDVAEDAGRGRLYLPADLLRRHGIEPDRGIQAVLASPGLDAACRELAALAGARFAEADRHLAESDRRALRPALLMMGVYDDLLSRLLARGWRGDEPPLKASKWARLGAALWRGLLRPRWRGPTVLQP